MTTLALLITLHCQTPERPTQERATLAAYLEKHPVPASLVLEADKTIGKGAGTTLAQFDRKTVKLGEITAIVPTEMVRFEDAPKQAPNLYDGLPRNAKVLYLMSTLTGGQWRLAGGKGIGLGDLTGEQRDVFVSILPKTLRWKRLRYLNQEGVKEVASGEVKSDDLSKVKLKIEQRLQFQIPLASQENAYTVRDPDHDYGQPGKEVLRRDDVEERNPMDLFGVEVRATVPNTLKKGHLVTRGLDMPVTVPAKATVGTVLERINAATGLEIHADVRIRKLNVTFPQGKARVGDLLDALALSVTGTYRKLGGCYLLVADAVGAGARKLRFALWEEEVTDLVREREEAWRGVLAKSGLVRNARLDADDPLQSREGEPPRNEKARLGAPTFFPSENLTSEQRSFLTGWLATDTVGRYRRDKVALESNLKYRFILPDGKALQAEGYLGPDWLYATSQARTIPPDRPVPLAAHPEGASRPLVVALDTPARAKAAVDIAKGFGFTELWVTTDRREVLAAAVETGFPVRLFARPWEIPRADADRTILGENGAEVFKRLNSSSGWASVHLMVRMQSWPRIGPVTVAGNFVSPYHAQAPGAFAQLTELGKTPGLKGVVLNEAMPHGYEATESRSMVGSYSRPSVEVWAFGYDTPARLAFFRAKGVDPVDLPSELLPLQTDMFNPFFRRYPQGELPSVDQLADDWMNFRARANQEALSTLGRSLGGLPIHIDVRRVAPSQPPLHAAVLRLWNPETPLPSYEGQYIQSAVEGDHRLLTAPWPQMADALTDFVNAARVMGARKELALAVDLTRIPANQWRDLLGKAFIGKEAGR